MVIILSFSTLQSYLTRIILRYSDDVLNDIILTGRVSISFTAHYFFFHIYYHYNSTLIEKRPDSSMCKISLDDSNERSRLN
jgi:hypothetical protein